MDDDFDVFMGRLRDRNAEITLKFRAEIIERFEAMRTRMAGPGEVVVPKEPTHDMLSAWTFTKDYGEHKTLMRAAYAKMLAAHRKGEGK